MDYLTAVILPQLLHGVVFGAALGLLALGLTVIFGLLGVMNFAHGELFMFGAYAGIAVIGATQSFWVALIAAPLLVAVVGAVTEVATLRPLYRREPLYGLILTFGLALVFRESARQIWGGDMRRILPPFQGSTPLIGMTYPNYRLFLLAVSSALLLGIWLLFTKTRAGAAGSPTNTCRCRWWCSSSSPPDHTTLSPVSSPPRTASRSPIPVLTRSITAPVTC